MNLRWFYRDPGVDSFNGGLTNGIEFTITIAAFARGLVTLGDLKVTLVPSADRRLTATAVQSLLSVTLDEGAIVVERPGA